MLAGELGGPRRMQPPVLRDPCRVTPTVTQSNHRAPLGRYDIPLALYRKEHAVHGEFIVASQ